jgi:hypothetical protein
MTEGLKSANRFLAGQFQPALIRHQPLGVADQYQLE